MGDPYHDKGLLPNRAGEQVRRERTARGLPGDVPEDLVYIRQSEIDRLRTRLEHAERRRRECDDEAFEYAEQIEELKRERDEARAQIGRAIICLRDAKYDRRCEVADELDAHLRDTGD